MGQTQKGNKHLPEIIHGRKEIREVSERISKESMDNFGLCIVIFGANVRLNSYKL